jgi:peptidoglycan/LPS O-acetylase OafA/YrhL
MKTVTRLAVGLAASACANGAWASGDPAVVYVFAAQAVCFLIAAFWILLAMRPWRMRLLPVAVVACAAIVLASLANVPDYASRHVWIDTASLLTCVLMLVVVRHFLRRHERICNFRLESYVPPPRNRPQKA